MKNELSILEQLDSKPETDMNRIKQIIEAKRNSCLELKAKKQQTKENIKKYRKKRFEINQQTSKQERISQDLNLDIDDLNARIKIEA